MGLRAKNAKSFAKVGPYFGPSAFVYDPERDIYTCLKGETLPLYTRSYTEGAGTGPIAGSAGSAP